MRRACVSCKECFIEDEFTHCSFSFSDPSAPEAQRETVFVCSMCNTFLTTK